MIELTDGFFITPGIEKYSEADYVICGDDPSVFAFDEKGIDDTGLLFMTSREYFNYLLSTEQYEKINKVAFSNGYDVVWSGEVNKYYPAFLLQSILHHRENLLVSKLDYGLFAHERNYLKILIGNPFISAFNYGYKNYITNKYENLSLERSIQTICEKLKTNELTIRWR